MDSSERERRALETMPLVEKIVGIELKKLNYPTELTREELRSFALEGLALALNRFDPTRGTSFSTYANIRIRGAIYDGLSQIGWFPRRLKRKINFIRRAEEMIHIASAAASPEDPAEAVFRLTETLKDLAGACVCSLAGEPEEPLAESTEVDELVQRKEFIDRVKNHIEGLPGRQREVVSDYFYRDMSLQEIAERMHVSRSWTSRLLSSGIARLRAELEEVEGASRLAHLKNESY